MIYKVSLRILIVGILASLLPLAASNDAFARQKNKTLAGLSLPDTQKSAAKPDEGSIAKEVRHNLLLLPWYNLFDWLEGEVQPDGTVILKGQVVRPILKSDAEGYVKDIKGVTKVENDIEVLPLSPFDDQLRIALYHAIYRADSSLFIYATRAVPPLHIVVKNGNVVLKGVVSSEMDKNLAYMAARGVPGIFDVKNELQVEK